jgi:hypothetical protein
MTQRSRSPLVQSPPRPSHPDSERYWALGTAPLPMRGLNGGGNAWKRPVSAAKAPLPSQSDKGRYSRMKHDFGATSPSPIAMGEGLG